MDQPTPPLPHEAVCGLVFGLALGALFWIGLYKVVMFVKELWQ